MLVLPAVEAAPATLIAPRLEATPARRCPARPPGAIEVATWEETEDPMRARRRARSRRRPAAGASAVAGRGRLRRAAGGVRARAAARCSRVPGSRSRRRCCGALRMRKDADEVALLRRGRPGRGPGRGRDRRRAAGRAHRGGRRPRGPRAAASPRATRRAQFSIVASGPNSASPHHDAGRPGHRRAASRSSSTSAARVGGYGSDITRTIWVTGGDAAIRPGRRVPAPVRGAAATPRRRRPSAVRPGVAVRGDRRRRARPDHRRPATAPTSSTGPGTGSGSRATRSRTWSRATASRSRPGMAFSVEPGIYLEGRYGARIEDIVVCGADGPDVLNESPRDLLVVAGLTAAAPTRSRRGYHPPIGRAPADAESHA